MDGSAQHENSHSTLAAQPAAAACVGVREGAMPAAAVSGRLWPEADDPRTEGASPRTRLERLLLVARQIQQR